MSSSSDPTFMGTNLRDLIALIVVIAASLRDDTIERDRAYPIADRILEARDAQSD